MASIVDYCKGMTSDWKTAVPGSDGELLPPPTICWELVNDVEIPDLLEGFYTDSLKIKYGSIPVVVDLVRTERKNVKYELTEYDFLRKIKKTYTVQLEKKEPITEKDKTDKWFPELLKAEKEIKIS